MKHINKNLVVPSTIEGFTGPMFSDKTKELLSKVDKMTWYKDENGIYSYRDKYIGFKPKSDNREFTCRSERDFFDWIPIPDAKPEKMLEYITENHYMVVVDEVQFFHDKILGIFLKLQEKGKHIIWAGLNLDFKRKPFGAVPTLMPYSKVKTLHALCTHHGCGDPAYYSQRNIDGKPAPYESKQKMIEGSNKKLSYEPRCYKHHVIPGKD